MSELNALANAFESAGGDRGILNRTDTAHCLASSHTIVSMRSVEGLMVDAHETETGIQARILVKEGVQIAHPVYFCFGMLHKKGLQEIVMDVRLERNSSAHFIAHCIFPNAEDVRHIMHATIDIGEGAEMKYSETHFHGLFGGVTVMPHAVTRIRKKGRYFADFSLTTGRVGTLDIDYSVEAGEQAIAELTARVFGHGNDVIKIKERIRLSGEQSRGLIKTRIAIEDSASAEVTGITEGNAAGARGHVDCMEIVKDNAVGKAIPIVNVTHPLAKVTHEAAIGSVDKRQMETLMAHGLAPEEAVDIIVKGILK